MKTTDEKVEASVLKENLKDVPIDKLILDKLVTQPDIAEEVALTNTKKILSEPELDEGRHTDVSRVQEETPGAVRPVRKLESSEPDLGKSIITICALTKCFFRT